MNAQKKHRSLFVTTLGLIATVAFLNRCGLLLEYGGECWTEMVPAVLGGAIHSTEDTVHLAKFSPPQPQTLFAMADEINPLKKAEAAAYCPTLDSFTAPEIRCITPSQFEPYYTEPGPVLEIRYESCKFRNRDDQVPGYWYGYHRLTFPTQAKCLAAISSGSVTTAMAGAGTINRRFGQYDAAQTADQNNFRLSSYTKEVGALWTDFPSGWYDSTPEGGIDIEFSGTTRTITVKGVHASGFFSIGKPTYEPGADGTASSFLDDPNIDYRQLANYNINKDYRINFDHTIDSPADQTFCGTNANQACPPGSTEGDPLTKTYSTVTVTGTGASRAITAMEGVRVQHNAANLKDPKTVGTTYLPAGETLTWTADPDCCWPTSGKIRTAFFERNQLNPRPDWKAEEVEFTETCGSVRYKAFLSVDEATGLPVGDPDYEVTHQFSHCF